MSSLRYFTFVEFDSEVISCTAFLLGLGLESFFFWWHKFNGTKCVQTRIKLKWKKRNEKLKWWYFILINTDVILLHHNFCVPISLLLTACCWHNFAHLHTEWELMNKFYFIFFRKYVLIYVVWVNWRRFKNAFCMLKLLVSWNLLNRLTVSIGNSLSQATFKRR